MKKFISIIITLALILCLSACGKNNKSTKQNSTTNKTTASDVSENGSKSSQGDTVVVPDVVGDSSNNTTSRPSNDKTNNPNANYFEKQNKSTSESSPPQNIKDNSSTTNNSTINQTDQSENRNTEEEKANRALQRQNVNILELQSELNSQFSQIDIGIDVWQLKIEISKNDSNFFSQDLWIQTSYSTSLFTPYDLKYSINITSEQKNIAISALKDVQQRIYNYAHSKYQYLKIKGGFYNGFYKYPNLHVGYETIEFCSWTNYGQDICFTGAYDMYDITGFGWHTESDDYVY